MRFRTTQDTIFFVLVIYTFARIAALGTEIEVASSRADENGESAPCAQTTERISESFPFHTEKSAEAMQRVLSEKYGLQTQVVKWEGRRNCEA